MYIREETSVTEENQKSPEEGKKAGDRRTKRRTSTYKHVNLDRQRPKLTREGEGEKVDASSQRQKSSSKPRQRATVKKDPNATLRIIPLGGLDAIGKNMTAFECNGDMILDDAGLMFPDDESPGIDLILPDYTYVLENAEKLRGIVVTHGHEDHTGSLPYLLKDLGTTVPI